MKIQSIFILFVLFFFLLNSSAQPLNQTIKDLSDSSVIGYGYFDKHLFDMPQFSNWFNAEYDNYKPDKKAIKTLIKKLPEDLSIVIVMGTWCPDSRREVPRFHKICDLAGIKQEAIIGLAVNRAKTTEHVNMEHLKIERVPTFIIYRANREVGRIIETPVRSLEKDLLEIIKKKPE
jgi:thiol-disulfide isomerase/thioredoxin